MLTLDRCLFVCVLSTFIMFADLCVCHRTGSVDMEATYRLWHEGDPARCIRPFKLFRPRYDFHVIGGYRYASLAHVRSRGVGCERAIIIVTNVSAGGQQSYQE